MENENEFIYELKTKFEYSFKGEMREASFISLRAPTMKEHNLASKLKQSIYNLIKNETQENDTQEKKTEKSTDDDAEITAELILMMMFASNNIDINVVFEQAKELFGSGLALIDGEQKLNNPLVQKMSIDDFQNLIGEYIVNFILA